MNVTTWALEEASLVVDTELSLFKEPKHAHTFKLATSMGEVAIDIFANEIGIGGLAL